MTVTQMRKTLNERCILPMAKFEQLRYTNIEYGNITCGYGLCDIRRSVEQQARQLQDSEQPTYVQEHSLLHSSGEQKESRNQSLLSVHSRILTAVKDTAMRCCGLTNTV